MNSKDTTIYRKILKSQYCTHTEVCDVIHELFKDRIVCKPIGKQFMWYIKVNEHSGEASARGARPPNDQLLQSNEIEVRKMIFSRLICMYTQTAEFMFKNAFNEGQIVKPHYIDIGNRLLKIIRFLNKHSFKNSIMRELPCVLC